METKEELEHNKKEYTDLNDKLKQVTGGKSVFNRHNILSPAVAPAESSFGIGVNTDFGTEVTGYSQGGATAVSGIPLDSDSKLKS